mgnify:CR=1 FL=1
MIKYLLEKEFKQLLRNPMLPRILLVFPCIILLVLPWAANFEIKNMNLSIVDNDRSPYSTRLVQKWSFRIFSSDRCIKQLSGSNAMH